MNVQYLFENVFCIALRSILVHIAMGGVDMIVLTAGVGENQTGLALDVCQD